MVGRGKRGVPTAIRGKEARPHGGSAEATGPADASGYAATSVAWAEGTSRDNSSSTMGAASP